MIELKIASKKEADIVVEFLKNHWRKDHILVLDRELFLYEFQNENNLNIAIAKDGDEVVGIFGYIFYNSLNLPDMAGSLWKVKDGCKEPFLGLKLRDFAIKNIAHRFFAAPGTNLQTKDIYKMLGMDFEKLNHFFMINHDKKEYKIAKIPNSFKQKEITKTAFKVKELKTRDELNLFNFIKYKDILPYKDANYVEKRFINHPYYKYSIFLIEKNESQTLFVTREVAFENSKALRVVDFYGDENLLQMSNFLKDLIQKNSYEYVDFLNYGIDKRSLKDAGFHLLQEEKDVVIPNYFEPFLQENKDIYFVKDKTNLPFRMCKADGDQDRPNRIKDAK